MSRVVFLAAVTLAVTTSPLVETRVIASLQNEIVQVGNGRQLLEQGLKLYQTEKYSLAVQVLQQAAVAFQTQRDGLNQALALNYVALAYQDLGQLAPASNAIADSVKLLQKNSINSKEYLSVRAQALNIQGQIQLAVGQSEKALASWSEATALYNKNQDKAGEIGSTINQAQALQTLGLYRRANITLTQVNELLQQQPDSQMKATGLLSLGNALRVVGVLDPKNEKAQDIRQLGSRQVLEESLAVASRQNLTELEAEIYLSLGNTAQALQNTTEALKYYEKAAATSALPTMQLIAQMNQLRLSVETGQWSSAQASWPEIQSQLASLPLTHRTVYARINFAQSLACLKQRTEARGITIPNLTCSKQDNTTKDTTTSRTPEWMEIAQIVATAVEQAKSLGDRRAESYALGTLGGLYEQTQQWSEAQTLTQQAVSVAESIQAPYIGYRWQWQLGRILKVRGNQVGAIAAYTKAVDNLKSLRTDLVAINRDVQYSFREGVEPIYRELVSLLLESNPSREDLKQARFVIEALQLAELDNFFRRACVDAKPVQIDEVDPTAAVIYPVILADRLEVIVSMPYSSSNPSQIVAHHTIKQNQKEVEKSVEQLREKLETRTTSEFLPYSQELYKSIIEPIAPELAKRQIKTLVFVLDGTLRNIPMGVLHDGKQYLVEKYNVALTPGLQLLNPRRFARTELRTIAGGLTEGQQGFSPLPNVEDELNGIKLEVPNTLLLLDEQFTTSAIEKAVKSLDTTVVHLATHGQFSSKAEDTFILAFNRRINVDELNDLLKIRETNQRGAIELLVLSACSTAAGDKRAALGIAGVAIRSGARSTLASLWNVDDEATATIMSEFYKQLEQPQMTKAEAIKRAQLTMLKNPQYEHPFYWAAYVLVGNWL